MSIVSDFFISTPQEAAEHTTQNPPDTRDGVRCDEITIVELSLLWALIERRPWNPDLIKEFVCVARHEHGWCLIHELPPRFLRALAAVTPDQAGGYAKQWATSPELVSSGADVATTVANLVRLAARALAGGRRIYIRAAAGR